MRGYFANRVAFDFAHEPFMTIVLKRAFSRRAGAFVDVGVNMGQTLIKVLAIDPERPYVGFEPQIGCCFFVDRFIRDNALEHMKIVPIALSDQNQLCQLFSNGLYDEMASITGTVEVDGRERRFGDWVSARVGDEVVEEIRLSDIAVVKIDVEGAELQVVSGLVKTLAAERPIVIFEVLPNFYGDERQMIDDETCRNNRLVADRLYALFCRAGYRVSQIDSDGNEKEIDKFDLDNRIGYVSPNFIAIPNSD